MDAEDQRRRAGERATGRALEKADTLEQPTTLPWAKMEEALAARRRLHKAAADQSSQDTAHIDPDASTARTFGLFEPLARDASWIDLLGAADPATAQPTEPSTGTRQARTATSVAAPHDAVRRLFSPANPDPSFIELLAGSGGSQGERNGPPSDGVRGATPVTTLQQQRLRELLATTRPAPAIAPLRASSASDRLATQMQRTFGSDAIDVPIHTGSAQPTAAGAEGVAVSEQVYIAIGYYDLTTTEGRERLGHEVAHVLQQRRGRDLPERLSAGARAGLEAEADRAGHAFARGKPFAVQGRAPAQVPLFKGAKPAAAPAATTTTIDLKADGRIERKPPAEKPAAGAPAAAPATPATDKPAAKEQLRVTYGSVQASDLFTIERNDAGDAVKLVGSGTLALPASKYMKQLKLKISLGPDGMVLAKLQDNATTTIQIGGLVVRSGRLNALIDHGQLTYALDGATIALPKNIGDGALTIQGKGDQTPEFDAALSINAPKMQPATMSFHASEAGYRAEGSTGIDIKQASGSVAFSLEKVGEDKVLWSAAGSVGYNSERLSGQLSVQYNADGELSGEGTLAFQIADFLTGQATVAVAPAPRTGIDALTVPASASVPSALVPVSSPLVARRRQTRTPVLAS